MAFYYLTNYNVIQESDTAPIESHVAITPNQYAFAVANPTAKLAQVLAESFDPLTIEKLRILKSKELYAYIDNQKALPIVVLPKQSITFIPNKKNIEYLDNLYKSNIPLLHTGELLSSTLSIWHEGLLATDLSVEITLSEFIELYTEFYNQINLLNIYENQQNEAIINETDYTILQGMKFP